MQMVCHNSSAALSFLAQRPRVSTALTLRPWPRCHQNKLVDRFSKGPAASGSSVKVSQIEEYGYALPLGRGVEKMPMPEFAMPTLHDVSCCQGPCVEYTHQD